MPVTIARPTISVFGAHLRSSGRKFRCRSGGVKAVRRGSCCRRHPRQVTNPSCQPKTPHAAAASAPDVKRHGKDPLNAYAAANSLRNSGEKISVRSIPSFYVAMPRSTHAAAAQRNCLVHRPAIHPTAVSYSRPCRHPAPRRCAQAQKSPATRPGSAKEIVTGAVRGPERPRRQPRP